MANKNSGIDGVLRRLSLNYGLAISALVLLTLGSVTAYSLYSSHRGLCDLIGARAETVVAPIARELLLGNTDQALDIFATFKKNITESVVGQNLTLSIDPIQNSAEFSCTPSLFYSSVIIPLKFGNDNRGSIQGTATYFSWKTGLILLIFLIISVAASLQLLSVAILRKIRESILQPISKLSRGQELEPVEQFNCVSEVLEIHSNLFALTKQIKDTEIERLLLKSKEELGNLSLQVAHDIRSPLTALRMAFSAAKTLPEAERNLIQGAIQRIDRIASDLLASTRLKISTDPSHGPLESSPLFVLTQPIVDEKKSEFRHRRLKIGLQALSPMTSLFAQVDPCHFKRLVSNLLNNAIEASADDGEIKIAFELLGGKLRFSVSDHGVGIPADILPQLGERGRTFGKSEGSGLGLFHAQQCAEAWNGDLLIQSQVGQGTQVTLTLPVSQPPAWFVSELELSPETQVVILDDDPSIHEVWKTRLPQHKQIHFDSSNALLEWARGKTLDDGSLLFLVDQELRGSRETGLDVIARLMIAERSILVSGSYDNPEIRTQRDRLGVRCLPKSLAATVPIRLRAQRLQ
jgi:signal transduction histidine kinase